MRKLLILLTDLLQSVSEVVLANWSNDSGLETCPVSNEIAQDGLLSNGAQSSKEHCGQIVRLGFKCVS